MVHVNFDLVNVQVLHFDQINILEKKVMTPKQVLPWLQPKLCL